MPTKNHKEETHLKLLDTYEQPEEFKRVLEEALALAEKRGEERVISRLYRTIGAVGMGVINKEQGYSDLISQLQTLEPRLNTSLNCLLVNK